MSGISESYYDYHYYHGPSNYGSGGVSMSAIGIDHLGDWADCFIGNVLTHKIQRRVRENLNLSDDE